MRWFKEKPTVFQVVQFVVALTVLLPSTCGGLYWAKERAQEWVVIQLWSHPMMLGIQQDILKLEHHMTADSTRPVTRAEIQEIFDEYMGDTDNAEPID